MTTRLLTYTCFLFISLFVWVNKISAQTITLPADTGKVFSLRDFQEVVLRFHPIVKQAGLLSDEARAKVLQSWGNFDPLLKADWDKKEFGNTNYYNYLHSELKIPVWLAGADLKVGYDRTDGKYINPDKRTNDDGLSYIGLSIPIGQGLLIDARRNTLKQARLMVNYAEAEKIKQINNVWFSAAKAYWDWYYAYRQYILIRDGVSLAQQRYSALANQVLLGDKPPIDSVEASITVFDRRIQLEKLTIDLQNTRLILSNYLWNNNSSPLELPADVIPQEGNVIQSQGDHSHLDSLVAQASNQHPELLMLQSKMSQLAIERRYRRELLKPKVNVTGSLVSGRTDFSSYVPPYYDYGWSNYKFGVDFALPLFLRSERGKLKQVSIQQQELDYDFQQMNREIRNDILVSYNAIKAYEAQLIIQMQSIINQQILLNGEQQKFELGESTLFLINSRETKLIDMKIKQAELVSGYQKKLAELYYKAGTRQSEGQ